MSPQGHDDGLVLEPLGPGWEETERALADVQADLSRTVPDAPKLVLLWRGADPERALAEEDWLGQRWAYLGKARDWYYGSSGGFGLPHEYGKAVAAIAEQVSDATTDGLLGYLTYWPPCPHDGYNLTVRLDKTDRCWWFCRRGDHNVAEVGHLA